MSKFNSIIFILFILTENAGAQSFNIRDFGAVADGKTVNTEFIQKTIDKCFENGGGTVYVQAGIYVTGTLHLKSNIHLYLESGATLKGSPNINDYASFQRPGYDSTNYGMFFTLKAVNVSIAGQGVIDGNEKAFFNWNIAKKIEWGGTTYTRQGKDFRKVTFGIGDGPVDPVKRRPHQMIIFSQCRNVLVEDILISKSPFWTLHFAD